MRLKSIDVQGFKSFADRTKLEFDDGITVVVGPNGSGKSNIADAIRWVLGEQSTKALRGGKMEDVIFNGTQTRKAQGVASVTLVIDNGDKILQTDASEVSITRKLYRSGDSEYRINGTLVRLKDVYELFMDTGIGRDGYAIIGQGKVAEIVSARSKERREIFEEAAGISKFRYRKTEAERKLIQSEENLVRLRDILLELQGRVAPLKEQSEKAKKYLDFAIEKKSLDISVWNYNLDVLKAKASKIEDQLLLAQQNLDSAQKEAEEKENEYSDEQEKARDLTVLIDTLRNQGASFMQAVSEHEGNILVLKNDVSHHNAAIVEANASLAQFGKSQEELKREIDENVILLEEKRCQLQNILEETDTVDQELIDVQTRHTQLSAASEHQKLQRSAIFEAIENAKVDIASSKTILSESNQRLENLSQTEITANEMVVFAKNEEKDCADFEKELDEKLSQCQNSLNGYILKRQSRDKKLVEYKEKTDELTSKINGHRQRAKLLSDMDRAMEGYGSSIKYVMNQSRGGALKGVIGPVSTLISVKDEHILAVETALGAAAQNIVVTTQETAKSAIRQLQQSKSGRATFLPMDTIRGSKADASKLELLEGFIGIASDLVKNDELYDEIIKSILGRTIIAQDLDCATVIAKKGEYRVRIVTLDGQVINSGGSLTGGFSAKSAGILGRGAEIKKLLTEALKIEQQLTEINILKDSVQRELNGIDAEIGVIEANSKSCNDDKIRCVAQLVAATNKKEQALKNLASINAERAYIKSRVEDLSSKGITLEQLQIKLLDELTAAQASLDAMSDERLTLSVKRDEILAFKNEVSTKKAVLSYDINSISGQIEKTKLMTSTSIQQQEELNAKISSLKLEIEKAIELIKTLEEEITEVSLQKQEKDQEVLSAMSQRTQCEERCTKLRDMGKNQLSKRDELYRLVVKLTEQKNGCDIEFNQIITKLFDEYELTRSDAQEQAQPLEDVQGANRRIFELRNKIKALGSVNLEAIEEYEEVYNRHKTLSTQINDVEKAKSELTKLINGLTIQMCEIFKNKFVQINKNFSKIFTELFDGGTANLSLSNPDDILESGIEIEVSPPGKVIKNLASLSGGEQSFVAIAIFFAILKVNPSPFCLMDEIEAALDDVNVGKFARYLHKLTEKTQFIAITHRRGTMEEADMLYGVAMQEEGISKLLQLKVSEIEKSFTGEN